MHYRGTDDRTGWADGMHPFADFLEVGSNHRVFHFQNVYGGEVESWEIFKKIKNISHEARKNRNSTEVGDGWNIDDNDTIVAECKCTYKYRKHVVQILAFWFLVLSVMHIFWVGVTFFGGFNCLLLFCTLETCRSVSDRYDVGERHLSVGKSLFSHGRIFPDREVCTVQYTDRASWCRHFLELTLPVHGAENGTLRRYLLGFGIEPRWLEIDRKNPARNELDWNNCGEHASTPLIAALFSPRVPRETVLYLRISYSSADLNFFFSFLCQQSADLKNLIFGSNRNFKNRSKTNVSNRDSQYDR